MEPVLIRAKGTASKGPSAGRLRSAPIVCRLSVLEVSYLDERRIGVVVFDEHDSHAPARVGAQEPPELPE